MKGWARFFPQFLKDLKLWLFCVLLLFLLRVAFILIFREHMGEEAGLRDVLAVVIYGVRFDSMVASYALLLPFLLSLSCHLLDVRKPANRVRSAMGVLFPLSSVILYGITIGYFKEFNDQFNHFLFGFIYDDTSAVLVTIWKAYHPLISFSLMAVVCIPVFLAKKRFVDTEIVPEETLLHLRIPPFLRISITLLTLVLFVCGIRGSVGRRPAQRKDSGVTKDEFLNKAVMNPFVSLRYAITDHLEIANPTGLKVFLPDEDVEAAAKHVFQTDESHSDLYSYMHKVAKGLPNGPARHVFMIVMEGYDAWPLMEKYRSLGLTRGLEDLGNRGIHIRRFLPGSSSTMTGLASIITGLADAMHTNVQRRTAEPYRSSVADTFNRLGYKTRFFYGGKLKWQRIDEFVKDQGFREIYGGAHMGRVFIGNEWGVDDEYLFDFIARTVTDDAPSFNLVLTTSYHPPFDVDIYGKGFPLREIPEDLKEIHEKEFFNLKILGHLWYTDKVLADFVRMMERKLKRPLFAVTGDHYARRFIHSKPDLFESSAVPFVLYGTEVLKGISPPEGVAGSHIDIGPTLIELAAPPGFSYYSLGHDLLEQRPMFLGVGRGKVIGADFIADIARTGNLYPASGKSKPEALPSMKELTKYHNAVHGISWWIIRNGSALSGKNGDRKGSHRQLP